MLYIQGASALVNKTEKTADQNQNTNGINLRKLQGDNSDLNPLIKGDTIQQDESCSHVNEIRAFYWSYLFW